MVWSIKHTLAALFAILAIVTGVQGGITIAALMRIERGVDGVRSTLLPSVSAIHDLEVGLSRVRHKQFRVVLSTPDADVINNNIKEVATAEDDLAAARRRYQPLITSAQQQELFDGFVAAWETYDRLTRPLGPLMLAGHPSDAQQLLLTPYFRILYRQVEEKLARAVALNTGRARDEAAQSVTSVAQAKTSAIVTMSLAALLGLAAMVLSYIRVVRPLTALTAVMRQLASGDIATPIGLAGRKDEIGAMIAALEVFRSSLIRTREAEAARHKTQMFIENIAATTPDGIIGFDEDGVVTFWNAGAEALLGFGADEMVGPSANPVSQAEQRLGLAKALQSRVALDGRTIETELQHRNGQSVPVELSYGRWRHDDRDMFCAIVRDIRARKANEEILHRLAHLDPLTQLPNRTVLANLIDQTRLHERPVVVLMTDLDRFKQVNDVLGHRTGDAVLKIASERLLRCVGPADTVSRIGGDEFVLLLADVGDPLRAAEVADAITRNLAEPFVVEGQTIHLSASVGIAIGPLHGTDHDELLACADMALYAAKADGRHGYRLFTPELRNAAIEETDCRQELCRAVDNGEFVLFYQPQIRLSDGALVGAEALIRWQHPTRGLLAPHAFLAVLESSRHAAAVGDWVIQTACRQAASWRERGAPAFRMGVNLSSAQFRSGDLADTVRTSLRRAGLPGSALEVEITENIILSHDEALIGPLQQLKDAGVGIAFDDYGTGYASFSLLKRFPLTRLKIDRSFVRDMGSSSSDAAIIRAILLLGRSLGLDVIAEGIETEDQVSLLQHKRCVEGQGYLFGKPMAAEDFARRFGLGSADNQNEAGRTAA